MSAITTTWRLADVAVQLLAKLLTLKDPLRGVLSIHQNMSRFSLNTCA